MISFDPVRSRDFWLRTRLQYTVSREPVAVVGKPPGFTHIAYHAYAEMQVANFSHGYLCGLSKELRATVEKHIAWMESQPEPDRGVYTECGLNTEMWRESLFGWRLALGVCKWLGRGDRAFDNLTAAAATDWQVVALADVDVAEDVHAGRRAEMSLHLATALAADAPLLGLRIYEAVGMKSPMEPATSPVRFGHWACRQLLRHGKRDESFVADGKAMLTANLVPVFLASGGMIETALWLKAIYFDSGVVQTPERAFAKAYDSTPGIPRPDFIPA